MPSIYLKQTQGSYSSGFETVTIIVTEEIHSTSNLFKKRVHKLDPSIDGEIWVYDKKSPEETSLWTFFSLGNYLTLTTGLSDKSLELKETHNNELNVENKYYTRSIFKPKIASSETEDISLLPKYTNEDSIIKDLIKENDSLQNILTYNIGKREGDRTSDNGNGRDKYNGGKIKIEDDSTNVPKLSGSGFNRYKHTPVSGDGNGKKACVIYNYNLLLSERGTELSGIQDQKYKYINVFWSKKVKEPLLLESNQNGSGAASKYYYHTWKNDSDDDNSLHWKEITKGQNVLDVKFEPGSDIYNQLTGSDNGKLLALLKAIEAHLLKTVVFMVDKQVQYGQNDFKSSFVKSSKYRLINKSITVKEKTESTEGECLKNTGFRVYEHDFNTSVKGIEGDKEKVHLRLIIPSSSSTNQYDEITLHKGETNSNGDSVILENISQNNKLYVYYYAKDPRPLLICYGTDAYKPKKTGEPTFYNQVNVDYTKWVKVSSISKCVCNGAESTTGSANDQLLKALEDVVGYLNPVQINPKKIPSTSSGQITAESPKESKYTLHKYNTKSIKMGISRENIECYHKFKYQPYGTNGSYDENFRLGKVIHTNTNELYLDPKCTLNYSKLKSSYIYDPLISVIVYYYDNDTEYKNPLLIELDFKVNRFVEPTTKKEYYKLKPNGGSSGRGTLQWDKDPNAERSIGSDDDGDNNQKLVNYLDGIRYSLKKVMKIYIEKQDPYNLCLSKEPGKGNGFVKDNSNKIQVDVYSKNGCEKLANHGYKCYVHKVSEINKKFNYNDIGGLKFFISGKNGEGSNDIEIKLYKENGASSATEIKQITYNKCMENIYVFFYCKHGEDCDKVPLMLRYNYKYYIPIDRDEYFEMWYHEQGLDNVLNCKDKYNKIKSYLDVTNKNLNRIDLTQSTNYGIPPSPKLPEIDPNFNLTRVNVTKISTDPKDNRPYCKLVHQTVNWFRIGEIWYNDKEIADNGVIIKGGAERSQSTIIAVDKNTNHREFTDNNNPNTVIVYYSTSDPTYKVPQLILLTTTDEPLEQDTQKPITSSTTNNKYGYYIIATNGSGDGKYKYDWREPKDKPPPETPPKPLTLDDSTELSLLNSAVILLERRKNGTCTTDKYGDLQIGLAVRKAIESETLKSSPGLKADINRLKNKEVTLKDITEEGPGESCLKYTGFRVITHDLSNIVDLRITGGQDVTLIASVRFMIPTIEGGGQYRLLTLKESPSSGQNVITLFHQKRENCVYVYFYQNDPRPLLLCYNKQAYRAFSLPSYDNQRWYKGTSITDCVCDKTKSKLLLLALVKVSNTLNPVEIENTTGPSYNIHKFNGQDISIKLTVKPSNGKFCYNRYTHTHNGTGSGGTGFRLGTINYRSICIYGGGNKTLCISSVIRYKDKYEAASEVVVYYYRGDPTHKNPLLVALCKNGDRSDISTCTSKRYYELQRDLMNEHKKYIKHTADLNLNPSKGSDLEKILDRILFTISKRLQIILGKRLEPIKLCPIERKRIKYLDTKKRFRELGYDQIGLQLLNDAVFVSTQMSQAITETLIQYHNADSYDYMIENSCQKRTEKQYDPKLTELPKSYQARVYKNDGKQEQGDSGTTQIKVQKINCKDLTNKGYRCYRHVLSTIQGIDEFGGLKLFLWDNRDIVKSENNDSECKVTGLNTNTKKQCCEIVLHGVDSRQMQQIAYTTCKGDLYVYFYGSDPRPLLLCYNNGAYAPCDLKNYDSEWHRVNGIESCECSETGFKADAVLKTLYKISMFLNPVRLSETIEAYQKAIKPVIDKRRKEAKEKGEPVGKWPEHNYTVQTFGDTEIRVRVKARDLQCYRVYTHSPADSDGSTVISRGFRLGDIFYHDRGGDKTCLTYPNHLPLQSVSLYYYMYDEQHRYPLIVQLDYGFQGPLDDYFRVCKTGEGSVGAGGGGGGGSSNGAQSPRDPKVITEAIAKNITWVKIKCPDNSEGKPHYHSEATSSGTSSSGTSTTGNGKCDPNCESPTTPKGTPLDEEIKKELKEKDAEFVKRAHEIQEKINRLNLAEAWFSQDYLDLVAQLQTLIERRCYDVRKKFEIEYETGEKNENVKWVQNSINVLDKIIFLKTNIC